MGAWRRWSHGGGDGPEGQWAGKKGIADCSPPLPPLSPGLATKPDADGLLQYLRPEGKSGGHGVGWSEIPQYGFKVPAGAGWQEIPVSIADLGGAEIDLRCGAG